jgi:hypothetical protein
LDFAGVARLVRTGFCQQSAESPQRFHFRPKNADIEQVVNDLARDYLIHRVRITELIYSKPSEAIRAFTDAFDLRKGRGHA